jgi:FAD/FMN-containing dehydrogenase
MIKLMQHMDESIKQQLKDELQGEVKDSEEVLKEFSRDASLFERKPAVVVSPKDVEDVKKLVQIVSENKAEHTDLSITARSAGSDMTG